MVSVVWFYFQSCLLFLIKLVLITLSFATLFPFFVVYLPKMQKDVLLPILRNGPTLQNLEFLYKL